MSNKYFLIILCVGFLAMGWDGVVVIQAQGCPPDAPLMKWFDRMLNGEG